MAGGTYRAKIDPSKAHKFIWSRWLDIKVKKELGQYPAVLTSRLALVVQRSDNAILWINLYPVNNTISFANTYTLDSDLSALYTTGPWSMTQMNIFHADPYKSGKGRQYKKYTSEPGICLTCRSVDFHFLVIWLIKC